MMPAPRVGASCLSEGHSWGYGKHEISRFGKQALSKHCGGQFAFSRGRTNSMFATRLIESYGLLG